MRNRIAIHIEDARPQDDTVVSWALFDPEGITLKQGRCPIGEVRNAAGPDGNKAEVHAYVWGLGLMLTEVDIPSRQAALLRKALPFMIEEQLVGDLRQTHLAIGPTRFGDSVPVAVVSHEQMIAWLDSMHKSSLVPLAVVPEQLLIPREPGSICIHVHGARALVRFGDCRGVCVAPENLALVLELALTQRAMPCNRIEITTAGGNAEDIALADTLRDEVALKLDRPILRTNYSETLIEILAKSARGPAPVFNLCQGGYRVDGRAGEPKPSWRVAWIASAACLLVFALNCIVTGVIMDSRAAATRDETLKLFHRMFPDERRVINLRRQAESRLASGQVSGSGALPLMAKLAASLGNPELVSASLQTVKFEAGSGALAAEIRAPSLAQIERLSQLLGEAGLMAKVMAASEEGGVASARLEIGGQ